MKWAIDSGLILCLNANSRMDENGTPTTTLPNQAAS